SLLAEIVAEVYTIERHAELAAIARARLAEQGYRNVHVQHGDGTRGWPEHAPYDAIVVAAGGPEIPHSLCAQLATGGTLVIPVGSSRSMQDLIRVTLQPDGRFVTEHLSRVRFVPLVGEEGWRE